jgi:NAD(P)-dependent dehydrogenase (short-subunit alcohol dehydrogenase family)
VTADVFSLEGRVAVVTGGTGAIGGAVAAGLARAGAHVVITSRTVARDAPLGERTPAGLEEAIVGIAADVLEPSSLEAARDEIVDRHGAFHILVNCAGGNVPAALLPDGTSPFALPPDAVREAIDLNLHGTLLPIRVLGAALAEGGTSSIVNVSSMAAGRALTRVGPYGAAKAAIESYTRWLAVELARRGTGIRVNAIAPGFVLGTQNRALLVSPDGTPTDRGARIVEHTPLGRLGEPDDVVSTVVWLVSDGARFVTGIVVAVDGGFGAYSGV